MPLNKLENFIKNTEGRILYVNPNDLDATDGIENQGNSLTKPFKTIQRALIESARFSYLRGNDNDLVERTTILLFPGNHIVDNRPGFGIKNESGVAKAVTPAGDSSQGAINTFTLTLNSNFDLTQEDNILYKFNSVHGGVVVPRGTSIVGLDLRKTKIKPKYVPNPTDDSVVNSAIFRITGACYFWQFTTFDGDETGTVYTDPTNFSTTNRSKPTFSHHKLTVFEYADGINTIDQYSNLTDLDIYYSKLTNAYNRASTRDIDQKYPTDPKSFTSQRPEFEIVGAFATDPLKITGIISGDGATPGQTVTVTTALPHNLTGGTPIKVKGVNVADYNISTKVSGIVNDNKFTFLLPYVRANLPAGAAGGLSSANAQVLVETDTVTGASPYVFNCSLRSVYGMQGMHADGSKATGFKSMVVAQFTGVSLQKDDRAFVKYNDTNRRYDGIVFTKTTGELLSSEASSTNPATVYHLDSGAVYRSSWRTSHIKVSNDAVVQIVSVFAIGYHSHFNMLDGADASVTNSNSNFGQFALAAEGFKAEAFEKDNKGFITSVITPRSIVSLEQQIEWLQIDTEKSVGSYNSAKNRLYLYGQINETIKPVDRAQGFSIGSKLNDKIYIAAGVSEHEATILMANRTGAPTFSSEKEYKANHTAFNSPQKSVYNIGSHQLSNGESVRVIADNGDLPENLKPHTVYYAITSTQDSTLAAEQIRLASSRSNAELTIPSYINTIADPADEFRIISRITDKVPGDVGHPMQYDSTSRTFNRDGSSVSEVGGWYINTSATNNEIYDNAATIPVTEISYILRKDDDRSLDEKIYKVRYVVPKELDNGRDPVEGFILQDSSSTNVLADADFTQTSINQTNYGFDRNTRFISYASYDSVGQVIIARSDKSHNLNVGDKVIVTNITCSINTNGTDGKGYNGTFIVTQVDNEKTFRYSRVDIFNVTHTLGTSLTNDTHIRSTLLPKFTKNDNQHNLFIYRTEVIEPYIKDVQDGIYHLFLVNGSNSLVDPSGEFTGLKYNQSIVNLYPELDRDNVNDNPQPTTSFAKRNPIGEVVSNDLKKSITRETTDKFLSGFDASYTANAITDNGTTAALTFTENHSFEALKFHNTLTGGSGHSPTSGQKTYHNIKMLNTASLSGVWDGATASVTIQNGVAIGCTVTEGGSHYQNGETLHFDGNAVAAGGIGGGMGARFTINTAGIQNALGDYVQVTGVSTGTDSYHRIADITGRNSITIRKESGQQILNGSKIVTIGPWVEITGTPAFGSATSTFNTVRAHGLAKGNRFRVLNASDVNLGDFIVDTITDFNTFTAVTNVALTSPKYILKHGLSSNEAVSNKNGENLDVRGLSIYDNSSLILNQAIGATDPSFKVKLPDGTTTATQIVARFPLGSYIQIGGEIMRVASSTLSGGSSDKITVIRGSLGSITQNHPSQSQIKKIKPLPVELRRPSILRASGHTFEYLGYGPGNYSTALPQVQNRTLTEREEFLSQSQETSCGNVVYTGMNDKGDFYIGNTKISSASGKQITFDIPIPTVTGEDPNRLSTVFDEIVVKERILVEGGDSKQILSQFDGPVTFNSDVRLANPAKKFILESELRAQKAKFRDVTDSDPTAINCTTSVLSGAVQIAGGLAVGKKVNICGDTKIFSNTASTNTTSGALQLVGGAGIGGNLNIGGDFTVNTDKFTVNDTNGNTSIAGTLGVTGNTVLTGTLLVHGQTTINESLRINAANEQFRIRNGSDNTNRFLVDTDNGNTTIAGTLSVAGNASFTGNVDLGDADTDTVSINGDVDTNLLPSANTKDIGVSGNTWGEVHAVSFHGDGANLTNTGATLNEPTSGSQRLVTTSLTSGTMTSASTDSGLTFNHNTNNLTVDGDIIAFASDDRLKTNKVNIGNALDKVKSLNGFTFKFNETGASLSAGFDTSTSHAGVSAQEVQAVLPEAVVTRADGEYLTVKYEKLVPLLLEAIKELSAKVDALS